jgi:hypothetical protein
MPKEGVAAVDEAKAAEGVVVATTPIFDSSRMTRRSLMHPTTRNHLLPSPTPYPIAQTLPLHLLLPQSPRRSLHTLYAATGP